jgi:hypothetical protein
VRRPRRGGPALDDRTKRFAQQHYESFATTSAIRRSICSVSSKTTKELNTLNHLAFEADLV